ncbi:hypothetical protein FACS1894166_07140 [Bacilli bacterium]|nr:hypothetical protein FACS1894166_07140 [Bacilli bacterium]
MDFNVDFTVGWAIGSLVCALLSFFFGTCEMSLTSTSLNKWNQVLTKNNSLNNRLVKKMIEHYKITLGVVLIGNMMTTIIASTFIASIVNQFVADNVLTVLSFVIAFVVLIFCEYLPKTLARNNPIS